MNAVAEAPQKTDKRLGIAPAKQTCVAICTPTLGKVSMHWTAQLCNLVIPMNVSKGFIPLQDMKGGEVGQVRNRLVQVTLAHCQKLDLELDSIFWLDDDVIPADRMVIAALRSLNADIAAGVYYCKGDYGDPLLFAGGSSGTVRHKPCPDGIIDGPEATTELWGYPQGLSLVKGSVFTRMRDELDIGTDQYGSPCWYKQPEFGMDQSGNLSIGGTEDFWFFENASKLGIKPVVNLTKHCFAFHYDLNEKVGFPRRQWDQWLRKEPLVWNVGKEEVVWR